MENEMRRALREYHQRRVEEAEAVTIKIFIFMLIWLGE